MTDSRLGEQTYVIPVRRVRECVDALLARDTHQYFFAYLFLRQIAARQGRTTDLAPDWSELGALLEVAGGPPGKPFLRPLWKGARGAGQEWLNSNLAGSYAASSLRGVPLRVVETTAAGRFNLRPGHWQLAFEHLLFKQRLPVLALAGFFFRDFGIAAPSSPDEAVLITLFRHEFGYGQDDEAEFALLYDTSWTGVNGPWSELFVVPEEAA